MTEQDVLIQIQTWIIANANNEITADVLRPILEDMLAQPNDKMGELADLSSLNKTNLVAAINEALQVTGSQIQIFTGTGLPTVTPPASYSIGDFYIHDNGTVQGFYQWNGAVWVKIQEWVTQADLDQLEIDLKAYADANSGDKNFLFTQGTPAASWSVIHNLNKYPSVTVLDSAGTEVEGEVIHTDVNNLTINFSAGFSGTATCN